ncbi:hypothetical protein RRG08_041211 [Elysia crispata]|uniref:Uncharacterized protein n=1 Tax=Elysia crispata TaxID=231223 RepID=A0AAE1DZN3_9GAST|nr:hypothetical protein RRG08_041211 [Elysia crispata]
MEDYLIEEDYVARACESTAKDRVDAGWKRLGPVYDESARSKIYARIGLNSGVLEVRGDWPQGYTVWGKAWYLGSSFVTAY